MGTIHRDIVKNGWTYFQDIQEEALTIAKQRWLASTNNVKKIEPFGYRNFKAATSSFLLYRNLILNMGPTWIGCRYRCPLIWYPPEDYHHDYELPEGHTNTKFAKIK